MSPQVVPPVAPGVDALDARLVRRLQAARGYPSVSVLMTTTPGAVLASKDVVRLSRLIDAAGRRLAAQAPAAGVDVVTRRLRALALQARRAPAARAVALFASHEDAALVHVPITVADRVVVDPTFATRDLVHALVLNPRFRLIVLSRYSARMLEGWPNHLVELVEVSLDDTGNCLRQVVEVVGTRHAEDPLSIILAGAAPDVRALQQALGLGEAVIGTFGGCHDRTSVSRLGALARPVLDARLRACRRAALSRLVAEDPSRCAFGIEAVWTAARKRSIGVLCVAGGYVFPARTDRSGERLEPVDDREHEDVLDDAIEEVMELTAVAGGEVVIVGNEALSACGHVAAILRGR